MTELRFSGEAQRWLSNLRDQRVRQVISARINRLSAGHFGDVRPVGGGVSELRIHHGPGFRVYFLQRGGSLIVVLYGGDKDNQARDIVLARSLAEEWRN